MVLRWKVGELKKCGEGDVKESGAKGYRISKERTCGGEEAVSEEE